MDRDDVFFDQKQLDIPKTDNRLVIKPDRAASRREPEIEKASKRNITHSAK